MAIRSEMQRAGIDPDSNTLLDKFFNYVYPLLGAPVVVAIYWGQIKTLVDVAHLVTN